MSTSTSTSTSTIKGTSMGREMGLRVMGVGDVRPTVETTVVSLRDPARSFPARTVSDEAFARWTREPRLRRASRLTLLLVEAAAQALANRPDGRLGIVGAFFTGPCRSSRNFFQPVVENGAKFASPAIFPETVYNSALSHLAHMFGVDGACSALVADDTAWVAALELAAVWLDVGACDQVLVVAGEELDASSVEAYAAARWLRGGWVPGEGAAALLLGGAADADSGPCLSGLRGPRTYRTRSEAAAAMAALVETMDDAPVRPTAGTSWLRPLEERVLKGSSPADPPAEGHAFTASAGWRTIDALATSRACWVPVWGLDHAVAAVRITPAAR